MYPLLPLLTASLTLILRTYPPRAFLKNTPLSAAISVYILTLVLDVLYTLMTPDQSAFDRNISLAMIALDIPILLVLIFVSRWVINRYVPELFSFKEMFVLYVLLFSAAGIIFSLAAIGSFFVSPSIAAGVGIIGFVFAIYMLLTFQSAISHIASITKSQAANVFVAPILLFILGWLLFLAFTGGVALMK